MKLSQFSPAPARPALGSDVLVGVNGGNADYLYSWQQISAANINTQTGNYVLALGDYNSWIEMNVGSANTLTIPPNASVAFPVGTVINVVQLGTGATQLVPGSGVTLLSAGSATHLNGQYSTATIYQRAINTWVALGALV